MTNASESHEEMKLNFGKFKKRRRSVTRPAIPGEGDNASRTAILDHEGKVLPEVAEVLGKKNEVTIAKIDQRNATTVKKSDTRRTLAPSVQNALRNATYGERRRID
ncbi:hypothetical protein OIDMADRAFT_55891 [Oidiodendron maius Zn]|uniref:Uncharacterized protein n=1 Tax=Oidiodendron maius (strain Zn) TaxID=913774 RepID=A0A0C3GV62_OIDMZ|nr:hypothetical protein OIDMADRAFT_55891 [Oidiodendron maius Zn]